MKRFLLVLTLIGIAAIYSIPGAHANQCCGGTGQGWKNYDKATVETKKGTVSEIKTYNKGGIHVMLKTGSETIDVHLGPASYLDSRIKIAKATPYR